MAGGFQVGRGRAQSVDDGEESTATGDDGELL